jgi:hypothetical protein
MTRRLLLPAVVVIVAVVAAGLALRGRGESGDGPLRGGSLSLGHAAEVGEPFSMTNVVVFNFGKKRATIERVRLLSVIGPLELLGVRARQIPSPDGDPLGAMGYPPIEYTSKPLAEDNVVPVPTSFTPAGDPDQYLQLVIGVRIAAPGIAGARQVEVTYRVGGRRYRLRIGNSVWMCAPTATYAQGGCPPHEDENRTGDRTLG